LTCLVSGNNIARDTTSILNDLSREVKLNYSLYVTDLSLEERSISSSTSRNLFRRTSLVNLMLSSWVASKWPVSLSSSLNNLNSRRGAQSFLGVDIMLTHPSYVHVPTPPSKNGSATHGINKTPFRTRKLREVQDSPLSSDVVFPLESRGLIAETLSAGPNKWQGIIQLLGRTVDGTWEDRSQRIERIREQRGLYTRLDLK
jgi:hypothetical protein